MHSMKRFREAEPKIPDRMDRGEILGQPVGLGDIAIGEGVIGPLDILLAAGTAGRGTADA